MSYDNSAASIDVANGPTYLPPTCSLSVDIGGSLDTFSGGSFATEISIGTNNRASGNSDICAYYILCEHSGVGIAGGLSISGTISGGGIFLEKPSRKGLYIQEDYWVNFLVQEQRIRLAIIQEHSALVLG